MSTFSELREQAEQDIRAHIRSTSPDSTHHFVLDSTNYFVEHGAALLAALRLWAEHRHMPDAEVRALLDLASARTLENIANELADNRDPEELLACVQLEGIAYAPPQQLRNTFEFARKALRSTSVPSDCLRVRRSTAAKLSAGPMVTKMARSQTRIFRKSSCLRLNRR